MTKITTQEQLRRTKQALAETDSLIAKECAYQPKFQKREYVESLDRHAKKLRAMIREYGHEPY